VLHCAHPCLAVQEQRPGRSAAARSASHEAGACILLQVPCALSGRGCRAAACPARIQRPPATRSALHWHALAAQVRAPAAPAQLQPRHANRLWAQRQESVMPGQARAQPHTRGRTRAAQPPGQGCCPAYLGQVGTHRAPRSWAAAGLLPCCGIRGLARAPAAAHAWSAASCLCRLSAQVATLRVTEQAY